MGGLVRGMHGAREGSQVHCGEESGGWVLAKAAVVG